MSFSSRRPSSSQDSNASAQSIKKGWTEKLELYLDKKASNDNTPIEFTHEDLEKKIYEYIEHPAAKVKDVRHYRADIESSGGVASSLFHHSFIVIRTTDQYWSFEKSAEGITVQRAETLHGVTASWGNNARRGVTLLQRKTCGAATTIGNIFRNMYRNGELRGRFYHIWLDNCIHFSKRIYDQF